MKHSVIWKWMPEYVYDTKVEEKWLREWINK